MGIKNAAPAYVCMTDQLHQIWEGEFLQTDLGVCLVQEIIELYRMHSPTAFEPEILTQDPRQLLESDNPGSTMIVDDVIAYARNILVLLAYFKAMLMTLEHHRVAVKLRKCRFLPSRTEFVGMDLLPHGNSPASSKYKTIEHLTWPLTFGDLPMLLGLFGFYSKWIPWNEERIAHWRDVLSKKPSVIASKQEESDKMDTLWNRADSALLEELKTKIISGPVLKTRPDWNRRFYLKMDWSSKGMSSVLLQAETTPDAEDAIHSKIKGDVCQFDKMLSGLRLQTLTFLCRRCSEEDSHRRSSMGELATG
jgi:hypothetical protein